MAPKIPIHLTFITSLWTLNSRSTFFEWKKLKENYRVRISSPQILIPYSKNNFKTRNFCCKFANVNTSSVDDCEYLWSNNPSNTLPPTTWNIALQFLYQVRVIFERKNYPFFLAILPILIFNLLDQNAYMRDSRSCEFICI